jgi:integrase
MQSHTSRPISGHVRLREGKRGATWYAKYRGPVRLPDGRVAIKQTEARIGPAWTGTGRPPIGTYTRRTAQAWLDAKLTDLRRGIGIAAVGDSATFAAAAAEWYRHGCHESAWKPSTRRDYRSALSAHLGVDLDPETGAVVAARAPFGDMRLEDITTDTIERWRAGAMKPYTDENGVQRVKLPRRTAVKVVAILHGIFARSRKPPFNMASNPAADVEPLRARYDAERFEFYTVEEVMALVRAAENEPDANKQPAAKQDAAIYLTAALTGLRLGEVLALRVRDVDFDNDTIRVLQSVDPIEGVGTTKSGHGRSVPMVPQVAAALARLLQRDRYTGPDDLVFPNDVGRWLNGSALRRRYREAQTAAGLRPLRFHDLRHTFGTHGRTSAESDRELQEWMGHADVRTTARYTHYRPRKDAARRLSQSFVPEQPETEPKPETETIERGTS